MFEDLFTILVTISILVYTIFKYINGNADFWSKRGFKTLKPHSIIKRFVSKVDLWETDKDYYRQLKKTGEPIGGFIELRTPNLMVSDPELIKKIMIKDFDSFVDRRPFDTDKVFAKMLFSLNGQEWKNMRSILSPTFTTGKIRRMFSIFQDCCEELMDLFRKEMTQNDNLIDIKHIFGRYSMAVIVSSAFGVKSDTLKNPDSIFTQMGKKLQSVDTFRFFKFILFFISPKLTKFLRLNLAEPVSTNFFQGIVQSAIKLREESNEKRNDFIQLMLEARQGKLKEETPEQLEQFERDALINSNGLDKNANKLSDDDIFAQCILFLFAGFDTIESAMVTCCIYLATHPDCQERLYKEIIKELKNPEHNGKLNYDLIQNKLEYMDAYISETQRLYPSAFRTERKASQDYKIPGTTQVIPKGTYVLFPIQSIQNDPENFENPEKFDPDRFLPENKSKINPYAFLPFGHGPRNCIGMRFALTEVKSMLANLVLNFKVEPCAKTELPVKYSGATGSLKPSTSLVFKFTSRVK